MVDACQKPRSVRTIGRHRSYRISWTRPRLSTLWKLYLESDPRRPCYLERLWDKWCKDCPNDITTKEALAQQLRKVRDSGEFLPVPAEASVDEPAANETGEDTLNLDEITVLVQSL